MVYLNDISVDCDLPQIRRHVPCWYQLHFFKDQIALGFRHAKLDLHRSFSAVHVLSLLSVHRGFGTLPKGLPQQAIACEGTSNFQPTRRSAGGRKYGSGYPLPMLAMKVLSSIPYYNGKLNLPKERRTKLLISRSFSVRYLRFL